MSEARFVTPPNWPPPPAGWRPPPGWAPDPAWGPAPPGWQFWESGATVHRRARRRAERTSAFQRGWLAVYWTATALSLAFVALAVTGSGVGLGGYLGTGLGAAAALLGASMSTRLTHAGISDVGFARATASMRQTSAAWLVFVAVLVVLTVVQTGGGATSVVDTDVAVDATEGLTSTIFGAAALAAVLGGGYSDYREAMAQLAATPGASAKVDEEP